MQVIRSTTLCLVLILTLSCGRDSEKSRAEDLNADRFSKHQKKDAHFVVDVIDTSYGLLSVAELGKERIQDAEKRRLVQQFIQGQTSAMLKLRTFAESNDITIPFGGPEKTKKGVDNLTNLDGAEFEKEWMNELRKLQHKLKTDIEGYYDNTDDTTLARVLDSTLLVIRQNNHLVLELDGQDKKSL